MAHCLRRGHGPGGSGRGLPAGLLSHPEETVRGRHASVLTLSDERLSSFGFLLLFSSSKDKKPVDEELNVDMEDDEDEGTRGRRRESSAAGDGYYNTALKDDERFTKM